MAGGAQQELADLALYRHEPFLRFRVGASEEVIFFPHHGRFDRSDTPSVEALRCCRSFQTLSAHRQTILERCVPGVGGNPDHYLRDAVRENWLVKADELVGRLSLIPESPPARVSVLGIVTRDRPMALDRAVASYLGRLDADRECRVTIMDDSSEACAVRNLQCIAALAGQAPRSIEISYADAAKKREYCKALAEISNVPLPVLLFALCGEGAFNRGWPRFGANRNAMLLDSPGEILCMADDDTVCRISRHPQHSGFLLFSSQGDSTDVALYPDREAAVLAYPEVQIDPRYPLEQVVGQRLSSIITGDWAGVAFEGEDIAAALFQSALLRKGQILAGLYGIVGDPGADSMTGLLGVTHEGTWQRFTRTQEDYSSAFECRAVSRMTQDVSITQGGLFMTTAVGLDNRLTLPPFPPVLRNEDGVFGAILARCYPLDFVAHLPYAFCHLPVDTRTNIAITPAHVYFSDILLAIIGDCPRDCPQAPVAIDLANERRIVGIGTYLLDLASAPSYQLLEHINAMVWRAMTARIAYFQSLISTRHTAPAYWKRDVECLIQALARAICGPLELADLDSMDQAATLLHSYGELLCCWPAIVGASRDLREGGSRLSQRV